MLLSHKALRSNLKAHVKAVFRLLNLEIRRSRDIPPPPPLCDDPLDVIRRRNSHDFVALNCPLADCVEFTGLSFSSDGWHPFVQAASEYLDSGIRSYAGSSLENYYASWQPRNACEAMLGGAPGPRTLEQQPSYVMHVPWSPKTVDETAAFMARVIEIENSVLGEDTLSPRDGYGLHGPVSPRKGRLEYERLIDVVDSIRKHGYDRSRGDATVHVLHRADEFRFLVLHGHHRAAALAALGYHFVPTIPQALVDSRYVDHWPGVYRHEWPREDALTFFNHLFDFDSRAWARQHRLCD